MQNRLPAPRLLSLLLLGAATAAPAGAQTIKQTLSGPGNNDMFGRSVRNAGDVNNDGRPDFVVGASEDGNLFSPGTGFARVYNGATGALLWNFPGELLGEAHGWSVDGAGDVNNDGFDDIVVGARYAGSLGSARGRVRVYNGQTGAVIRSHEGPTSDALMGSAVAGAGDVNDDGFDDYMGAAPDAANGGITRAGLVRVWSGANGLLLHEFKGTLANSLLGRSLDGAGDVNGDGHADLLIGSARQGAILYSGATGAVIRTYTSLDTDDNYAASVANAGDINLDGIPDQLIGAPEDGDLFSPGPGYAHIRSGANGVVLRTLVGIADGDRFGVSVGGGVDIDGDGRSEAIVGADQNGTSARGYARVFNGLGGAVVHTFNGDNDNHHFGDSVDIVGDGDGDGLAEFVIGAPHAPEGGVLRGLARVWETSAGGCPAPSSYCQSGPNSSGNAAVMSTLGTTSVAANDLVLRASGCPTGGSVGVFYYGNLPAEQAFGNGFRCVGGSSVYRLPLIQVSGSGIATYALDNQNVPAGGPIGVGSEYYFQFWFRDAAAGGATFDLSDGMRIVFCP